VDIRRRRRRVDRLRGPGVRPPAEEEALTEEEEEE
jgi:hypothetical protein